MMQMGHANNDDNDDTDSMSDTTLPLTGAERWRHRTTTKTCTL